MKTLKLKSFTITGYSILIILLLFSSCSQKISFITSAVVPSAQGHIKITKDNNNNSAIDITVQRLADPTRLTPEKVYVVWVQTESNGTKNVGQLNSSDSFFSSTMKASLQTVTPFKPVKVFVTAEQDANIQYPGSVMVLTTKSFN
jgi:hypothetical protein